MVITAPRVTERVRACPLSERSDRLQRSDLGNGFDQLGDFTPAEREVPMASAAGDRDKPGIDEPGQMVARSRRGDTRFRGEQTRRQRAAVQERQQNLCAGRLGEQRPDSREIGLTHRLLLLAHQCADPSARTFRSKSKHLRATLIAGGSKAECPQPCEARWTERPRPAGYLKQLCKDRA